MSWSAKLTDFKKKNGIWFITIYYIDSDSDRSFAKNYKFDRITKKQLRGVARNEISRLVDTDTTDMNIPIGGVIDITPDDVSPPSIPTQDEIDEKEWFTDWNKLKSIQSVITAIPSLSTAARQTIITNLQIKLDAGWKNVYLEKI